MKNLGCINNASLIYFFLGLLRGVLKAKKRGMKKYD